MSHTRNLVILLVVFTKLIRVNGESSEVVKDSNQDDSQSTTVDPYAVLAELKFEREASKQLNLTNVVSRIPCTCARGQCGCCTGSILQSFNQKACMNVTYEPDDFAFTAAMSLNDRVLYKNKISGKNPPPMCIRVPRFRFIRVCVRFSNVYFAGANMHTCVTMAADWEDFTLFERSFDCFRIGAAGVAIVPPEDGGGISTNTDEDDDDDDDDDYDDSA